MILITAHHLTACIVLVLCAIEVAEEVFNRCTFTNATKDGQIRPDSKDYRVIFNYEFLEDFQDRKSKIVRALTRRYINVGASWSHNQLVSQPFQPSKKGLHAIAVHTCISLNDVRLFQNVRTLRISKENG